MQEYTTLTEPFVEEKIKENFGNVDYHIIDDYKMHGVNVLFFLKSMSIFKIIKNISNFKKEILSKKPAGIYFRVIFKFKGFAYIKVF